MNEELQNEETSAGLVEEEKSTELTEEVVAEAEESTEEAAV